MIIQKQWQAAKEAFKEQAFRCFKIETMPKWWVNADSNDMIDRFIDNHPDWIMLKQLPDLYTHDVEFYGEQKAITLWQWRYANDLNNWQDCNKPLSFKADKVYRRKPS